MLLRHLHGTKLYLARNNPQILAKKLRYLYLPPSKSIAPLNSHSRLAPENTPSPIYTEANKKKTKKTKKTPHQSKKAQVFKIQAQAARKAKSGSVNAYVSSEFLRQMCKNFKTTLRRGVLKEN